jgi:hypothetical protein
MQACFTEREQAIMKLAPIVFLDFDGVTHPYVGDAKEHFTCLPRIEAVLRRHVSVEVVVSSTWRQSRSLTQLREFFAADIAHRVVGSTSVLPFDDPKRAGGAVREVECRAWLTDNRPGHPWVAIDDVPWNFAVGCPHLILTHRAVGFSLSDANHFESVLERLSR